MMTRFAPPTSRWTPLGTLRITRDPSRRGRLGLWLVASVFMMSLVPAAGSAQERKPRPAQPRTGELQPEAQPNQPTRRNRAAGESQPARGDTPKPLGPQAPIARLPLPPPFVPLPPEEEKFIDNLLTWWESQSKKIKRYRCDFVKREYDTVTGPAVNPQTGELPPKTISYGKIRYMVPDKGMFKVEQVTHYQPPKKPGGKPEYVELPNAAMEHWVCNGEAIFTYNYSEKELLEMKLPSHLQGNGIVEGPLPFLFGADAQKVKDRYWLHVITTEEAAKLGEYWLEAFPKRQEDASSFKMVHVIFDKEYLPRAIKLFPVNYDPLRNQTSTLFVFEEREVNFLLEKLNPFQNSFYEPEPPGRGWKKRTIDYVEGPPPAAAAADRADRHTDQARRPAGPSVPRTEKRR